MKKERLGKVLRERHVSTVDAVLAEIESVAPNLQAPDQRGDPNPLAAGPVSKK